MQRATWCESQCLCHACISPAGPSVAHGAINAVQDGINIPWLRLTEGLTVTRSYLQARNRHQCSAVLCSKQVPEPTQIDVDMRWRSDQPWGRKCMDMSGLCKECECYIAVRTQMPLLGKHRQSTNVRQPAIHAKPCLTQNDHAIFLRSMELLTGDSTREWSNIVKTQPICLAVTPGIPC